MVRSIVLIVILAMTGCALAQNESFVLESYGKTKTASLVSGGVTDNTTEIQAMIDAQYAAGGGTVDLPAGAYAVTGLTMHWNDKVTVNLRGDGQRATYLVKIGTSSAPILSLTASTNAVEIYSTISDLGLVGNARSGSGITATGCAYLTLKSVYVADCDIGVDFQGTLISRLDDVNAKSNNIGVRCRASGSLHTNMVSIVNGSLRNNSAWGLDFGDGSGLSLQSVDIEHNGTANDTSTGGIVLRGTCDDETGLGSIAIKSSWLEGNHGTSLKCEECPGLAVGLDSCHIMGSEQGRAIVTGRMLSVNISSCISGTPGDTWVIDSAASFVSGGVVSTLSDTSTIKTYVGIATYNGMLTNLVRSP